MSSNFLSRYTSQGQHFAKTNLMFLTMGNLEPGAKTLWVHFCFVVAFTFYGMWLLDQHYKVRVRSSMLPSSRRMLWASSRQTCTQCWIRGSAVELPAGVLISLLSCCLCFC
jgi:hypothetical protein